MGIRVGAWNARAVMAAVLVPFAAAGLVACSSDDDAGADLTRYCELVDQLDQALDEVFVELGEDPNATEEDFIAATAVFIDDYEDELDAVQAVAPEEIRDDVVTLVAAQRSVADGDIDVFRSFTDDGINVPESTEVEEADEAEERASEFRDENCTDE